MILPTTMTFPANDSRAIDVVVLDGGGRPQNIADWRFTFTVYTTAGVAVITKTSDDVTQISIIDAARGIVAVYLQASDSVGRSGDFQYQFVGYDAGGNPHILFGPSGLNMTSTLP